MTHTALLLLGLLSAGLQDDPSELGPDPLPTPPPTYQEAPPPDDVQKEGEQPKALKPNKAAKDREGEEDGALAPTRDRAPPGASETDAFLAGGAAAAAAGAVALGASVVSGGFLAAGVMAGGLIFNPVAMILAVAAAAATWLFAAGLAAFAAGAVVLLLEEDLTEGGEWLQLGCVSVGTMAAFVIIPLSFLGGSSWLPCDAVLCAAPRAAGQPPRKMFGMSPLVTHPAAGIVTGGVTGALAGGLVGAGTGLVLYLAAPRGLDLTLAIGGSIAAGLFLGTTLGAVAGAGAGGTLGVLEARPQ